MTNYARKLDANRKRGQKHRDKRAAKRESARSHSQQVPRSQRRANTVQFPTWATNVFQSSRKKVA